MPFPTVEPVIVMDIGRDTIKCGHSEDAKPAEIENTRARTKSGDTIDGMYLSRPRATGMIEDALEKMGVTDTPDMAILHILSPATENKDMSTYGEYYFEHHLFREVIFQHKAKLALHYHGCTSGIAIDCGHTSSYVVPVYEGHPLPHATVQIGVSGNDVSMFLKYQMTAVNFRAQNRSDMKVIKRIKEEHCYVERHPHHAEQNNKFFRRDGSILQLSEVQQSCGELLYDTSLFGQYKGPSVDEAVIESIAKLQPDLRVPLCENVVLSGGTTDMQGFGTTLQQRLRCSDEEYLTSVHVTSDVTHGNKNTAWLGAQQLINTHSSHHNLGVSKADYDELGDKAFLRTVF